MRRVPLDRILAVGLLSTLLVCLVILVVIPLATAFSDHLASIDRSARALAAFHELIEQKPRIELALEQAGHEGGPDAYFWRAETEAAAAAELQRKVKQAISTSRTGQLRTISTIPRTNDQGLDRFGVRIQMTTPPEDILAIFLELESSEPILFVDNVDIRADRRARQALAHGDRNSLGLDLGFEIYGYLEPGEEGE